MMPTPTTPLELLERHRGLVSVLVAATAVRLSGLTDWWLNPDEGIYFSVLTRADASSFWSEVAANAHPPLYYALLRGLALFTWDFLWLRAFSVLCGLAAVVGVWAVAMRLASRPGTLAGTEAPRFTARGAVAGFIAGLMLAFAPGGIEPSQVMRPYMMQLALLAWALFLLLRTLDEGGARNLVAYITLASLALLTHYSTVFALGVFGLLVLHDGIARGFRRRSWRLLAGAHIAPAAVLLLLWVFHLRELASSTLADEALDGWLRFQMIDTPAHVWRSLVGFQYLVAVPWLRAPVGLALLAAIGTAIAARDARVTIIAVGALLFAIVGAALGVYPLGPTRHSTWLMAFTVPAVAWFCAALLDTPFNAKARARLAIVAIVIVFGGPLGRLPGFEYVSAPQRILLWEDLASMANLLDPATEPDLVIMNAQTFYLLMPFYTAEREAATFSEDSTVFHFRWGERDVIVSNAWDLTTRADEIGHGIQIATGVVATNNNRVIAADIGEVLSSAETLLPEPGLEARGRALLLEGGWVSDFPDQLLALDEQTPFISFSHQAPGLHAFLLELGPLATALRTGRDPGVTR